VSYPAGDAPVSVAIADLDSADGPDLAVADVLKSVVLVLLNQGNGTFAPAVPYQAGRGTRSVAVGDFDGVNGPDLAVANGFGDNVSVLLNQCLFEEPIVFSTAGAANRLDIGDLTGDQEQDVIVVIPDADPQIEGTVQVFVNLGTDVGEWQGFTHLKAVTVGLQPSAVALGQLNPVVDSYLDAAVTNSGDNTIALLFNDGSGTLSAETFPFGDEPSAVAIAEYTGDTFLDLAVTNRGADTVSILASDGNGGFAFVETQEAGGGGPTLVDPSDVDDDKDPDLTIVNQTGFAPAGDAPGNVAVILTEPDGLGDPMTYPIGLAPTDLALRDLNLEGGPDIAAANGGDGTVSLLVSQGGGIYSAGILLPVGDDPLSVEATDLDGDGDNDLAVIATDPMLQTPAVLVFENIGENTGDLSFAVPIAYTVGVDATPNFLAVGDFNGDGEPDLVTVNSQQGAAESGGVTNGSVSVLLNRRLPCLGDADFDTRVGLDDVVMVIDHWGPCSGGSDPCPGDVNADGFVNIVDFLTVLANWGDCP
jgi:hypothetical protein